MTPEDTYRCSGDTSASVYQVLARVDKKPSRRITESTGHRVDGSTTPRATDWVTYHNATHCDERSGSEAPFLGTEQTSDGDISSRPQLTVSLDNNTATQVVQDKRLVSLGQTKLPGQTSVLDTGPSGGASATIVAGDQDVVSLGLGYTSGNNTNTSLRDKLDRDSRARAGALEIVDELLQILNGVDIVVRRRRDETDAWSRVTSPCNALADLVTGQFTSLSWLRALGHLDLELVRVGQVCRSDTETPRGNLLDGRSPCVSILVNLGPLGILSTLASVGLAAETVH